MNNKSARVKGSINSLEMLVNGLSQKSKSNLYEDENRNIICNENSFLLKGNDDDDIISEIENNSSEYETVESNNCSIESEPFKDLDEKKNSLNISQMTQMNNEKNENQSKKKEYKGELKIQYQISDLNFYNESHLDMPKRIIYNWFNNNKAQDQTEESISTLIICLIQNHISVLELVTENGYVELIHFFVHNRFKLNQKLDEKTKEFSLLLCLSDIDRQNNDPGSFEIYKDNNKIIDALNYISKNCNKCSTKANEILEYIDPKNKNEINNSNKKANRGLC